jgi:hypothetical protein
MQRETIISTLHRVDASQSEVETPRPLAVEALSHLARHLVSTYRIGESRTFDLSGLQRELLEVLVDGRLSPASAALVLHQVLAPLPISNRGTLALFLTNAIRNERLARLSHGSLLTLRRAVSLEESDLTADPLDRLNGAIATRQAALRWNGAVLLVADRISLPKVEAAIVRIGEAVAKRILIVLPGDEINTSREVIFEHLRLQVRCGDESQLAGVNALLDENAVQLLPETSLHAARKASGYDAARRFLRVVAIAVTTPLHLQLVVPRSKA